MSVVVFDGKCMAADYACLHNGVMLPVKKIFRLNDGSLLGISGKSTLLKQLVDWANGGFNPAEIPPDQLNTDKSATLMHVTKTKGYTPKIQIYENSTSPYDIDNKFAAIGSGIDAALGALHAGASAVNAVKITALISPLVHMVGKEGPSVIQFK